MFNINQVYQVCSGTITRFNKTKFTLAEIRDKIDINTTFFISVKDDAILYYSASKGLNLNLLLLETPFNNCTTWTEIEQTLTDTWVTSYKTTIPGYTADGDFRKSLNAYYVFSYLNEVVEDGVKKQYKWDVDYFDHREWDKRSIPLFKGVMPDLLLQGPEYINHKNCVVCCNGHMLLTEYVPAMNGHKEQLLVKDGARHLWSTSKNFYPDVICLDFTELGDTKQYPLYQFKSDNLGYDGTSDIYMKFKDINLRECTPLIVIAGALFFPHELSKTGDNLRFNIQRSNVINMLARKNWDNHQYISGTTAMETKITPIGYLTEEMWKETCRDAFVILIKNSSIYTEVYFDYQFATHRLSQSRKDICGVLRQRSTGIMLGYMDSKYHNVHLLYMNADQPLWRLSELQSETVVSTTTWGCLHTNRGYMDKFAGSDDDSVTTLHKTTLDMFNLIA